jgi:hypothetical protein
MKVYVVFKYNAYEDMMEKIFFSEEKAKMYVEIMNETSNLGWMYVQKEVEE